LIRKDFLSEKILQDTFKRDIETSWKKLIEDDLGNFSLRGNKSNQIYFIDYHTTSQSQFLKSFLGNFQSRVRIYVQTLIINLPNALLLNYPSCGRQEGKLGAF